MKLAINLKSLEWWFWGVTLAALITGLAGVEEGFYVVVATSVVQFVYFTLRQGMTAFPTQVRLVYGLVTIIFLFDPTRIGYWLLLVGTVMVTLFNRCIIARLLLLMPWNKDVTLS